jgi:predicted transcriptional regulator
LKATRGLALTTVATVLTRLEKRGLVSRRRDGNHYLYHAAVTEAQVRSSMIGELRDSLFQGDVSSLVSHLLQDAEISEGDLEKVLALIDKKARRTAGDGDD